MKNSGSYTRAFTVYVLINQTDPSMNIYLKISSGVKSGKNLVIYFRFGPELIGRVKGRECEVQLFVL